jgi:hypothetical protein
MSSACFLSVKHLNARIVEPEEMAVARQWLGKHFPLVMNTHVTTEELLDIVFFSAVCVISDIQYVVKGKQMISSSQNFLFGLCPLSQCSKK